MPLADCCLILPPGSDRRGDVKQLVLGPCADRGFDIIAATDHVSATTSPLAIAYLGNGSIDPNVALLVGFRLAERRPTILLAGTKPIAPAHRPLVEMFSALCYREVSPVQVPDDMGDDERRNAASADVRTALTAVLEKPRDPKRRFRSHPYVEFRYDRHTQNCPCSAESPDAKLFFAWKKSLIGVDSSELTVKLLTMFYEPQKDIFMEDQARLFGKLLFIQEVVKPGQESVLWAKYPVVFQNHPLPEFNERAFLPIIVSSTADDRYVNMRVLYLEVNSVAETESIKDKMDAPPRYVSKLQVPWEKLPIKPPSPRYEFDVFLAHNSEDKKHVRKINQALIENRLCPYFDENCMGPGWVVEQLANALKNSRVSVFFLGSTGLGRWQGSLEMNTIMTQAIRKGHTVIPVLLPGVDRVPDDVEFMNGLAYVKFDSLDDLENNDSFGTLLRYINWEEEAERTKVAANAV